MGDLQQVCRSCLVSNEGGLLSMDSIVEDDIKIKDCLQLHLNVNMAKHDGLPQTICLNCYDSVLRIRKFHLRYLQSEECLLEQDLQSGNKEHGRVEDVVKPTGREQDSERQTVFLTTDGKDVPNVLEITKIEFVDADKDLPTDDCDNWDDSVENDTEIKLEEPDFQNADSTGRVMHIYRKPVRNLIYCLQCNQEFGNKNDLRIHFNAAHGKDNARGFCTRCSTVFPTRGALMIHLHTHGFVKNGLTCRFCRKKFATKEQLVLHQRTHAGDKPHKCPICGRGFLRTSDLGMHMSLHTDKSFECSECDKKFSKMSFLEVHLKSHDCTQPFYKCHLCEKTYPTKNMLKKHLSTHSGTTNFICELCGTTFKGKDLLVNHMNTHKKPYQCPRCPIKAANLYSYRLHMAQMHTIQNNPKL